MAKMLWDVGPLKWTINERQLYYEAGICATHIKNQTPFVLNFLLVVTQNLIGNPIIVTSQMLVVYSMIVQNKQQQQWLKC